MYTGRFDIRLDAVAKHHVLRMKGKYAFKATEKLDGCKCNRLPSIYV
jgi:hypothetical protein